MKSLSRLLWKTRIWRDKRGQDLIEYALLAAFLATAAGAVMPGIAGHLSTMYQRISNVVGLAASQGS